MVKEVIFKFEEDENEFSFSENLSFTNDLKLVKTLMRENIKNGDSSLILKSMNNLPIYDVIQIKINLLDTGTFLANFDKENFDEETREKLISDIKKLKDDVEPTLQTQKKKISKLIKILNKANPLYVTFRQHGDINITFDDFKTLESTSFMLIVLGEKEKEPILPKIKAIFVKAKESIKNILPKKEPKQEAQKESVPQDISKSLVIKPIKDVNFTGEVAKPNVVVKVGLNKLVENKDYVVYTDDISVGNATAVIEFIGDYQKTPQFELEYKIIPAVLKPTQTVEKYEKTKKERRKVLDFKLYTADYLFVSIFSLLFSFGIYTGVYEALAKQTISVFLFILSVAFLGVLYFSFYSTIYKRRVERYKNLKYWLLLYIAVGAGLGLLFGFFISSKAMKLPEDVIINNKILNSISIPTSYVLALLSPLNSIGINFVLIKIKNKK